MSAGDPVDRLPAVYAAALRLRAAGLDDEAIAGCLGTVRQAVGPLVELAEAKLDRVRRSGQATGRSPESVDPVSGDL